MVSLLSVFMHAHTAETLENLWLQMPKPDEILSSFSDLCSKTESLTEAELDSDEEAMRLQDEIYPNQLSDWVSSGFCETTF